MEQNRIERSEEAMDLADGLRGPLEADYGNPPVFTEQDAEDHETEKAIRGDR